MIIAKLIALALGIPAFWLTLHYNMHMFQLNTYMNNEQNDWLKRNSHLQWILRFAIIFGIVSMLIEAVFGLVPLNWVLEVLCWLTLIVIILVYRLMKEMNSKKPLKFTSRVKRLVATDIVICVAILLIVALAFCLTGNKGLADLIGFPLGGYMLFITGMQLHLDKWANTVNKPIEKGVRDHYINDAKRILKENPDITIIGVTGSYGKTSVKFFLETLLQTKYSTLVTPESYNTPMGVVITIRTMMKPTHEVFVCEMGARYVGEIKELCDLVHPHHGIIASIGPQHLDTFGSLENIQKTKFELADALPEGGMLFLNGDNEYINEQLDRVRKAAADGKTQMPPAYKEPVMYHSQDIGDGYHASDVKVSAMGTEFTVTTPGGESGSFTTKLVGAHNVINIMGAIAVAHKMGISLSELRIPVRRLRPVSHRMEMKTNGNVTIIDDAFNSNPIGSKAAVETLALFEGMRILITPGMVELGADEAEYNRKFGTYAADCCDKIFLVGRKHTEPIKEGILSKGFAEKDLEVFDNVQDAIARAYAVKTQDHKYILLENDLPDNY